MGKSKNFTAAEKYFQKKELEYKKQLKEYEQQAKEVVKLKQEIIDLRKEKVELEKLLNKTLELKDLTKEDIKAKLEAEKSILHMQGLLSASGISGYLI